MDNQLLHTPDGVRDIYRDECQKKLAVQDGVHEVFRLYGYEDIETPTYEFFDIFNKERGSVSNQEMFKFFDRDNNTLVLRPDVTPAIARCVVKYFMDSEAPLRLCYLARTFINNSSYQGRLKETTHTGAEMIGEDSPEADAEMIAMVITCLKSAGLKEFQVELGQVEFFRGLADEAGMDEETQEELRELIENKNYFGVEELISERPVKESMKEVFLKLPQLFGPLNEISRLRSMTDNKRALKAIERLERVQTILEAYGMAEYVSYDLGMLSKYKYYTGIIFKAYTYGTGDYIVTGGRYDKLLLQFGKDRPAVGFVIVVDRLLQALSRQKIEIETSPVSTAILYDPSAWENAVRLACHLRENQMAVQMIRREESKATEVYRKSLAEGPVRNLLFLDEKGETVHFIGVRDGKSHDIPFAEYMM
ncbi:ATP phosphoribosyltransferase regulatory subunit [Clostridium sp. AM58-1XD]|uniref:ATP phosphoribosyltransferase regulatory subunit n=1 Tax=Clostridium sp. AM58-1XD TaxID=2292307 RepID=UPI000E5395BE|nr:ATP phosphoribosyltransferase regulatory subunit [Clostridium sp. AM58-1XD]